MLDFPEDLAEYEWWTDKISLRQDRACGLFRGCGVCNMIFIASKGVRQDIGAPAIVGGRDGLTKGEGGQKQDPEISCTVRRAE
eukprot:7385211-Prymnesium_polylepis.1